MSNPPIAILVPGKMHPRVLERLGNRFDIIQGDPTLLPGDVSSRIRGAAVSGPFPANWIDALPMLGVIANFGVGYDGIDVKRAAERGIIVTNTPEVLNDEVADTTIGLLLNTIRQFPRAESYLRAGRWESDGAFALSPLSLRHRHVGLYGLGRIGLEIARRLEPFKVRISYHTRSARDDVPYTHFSSLKEMASAVDTLIAIVPKTPQTHRTIDADILSALGSNGVLINVGRGWTVDDEALIAALENGVIAGAGLDVFYDEPRVPAALLRLENVCLLPHVASASVPTRNAMADLVADNLIGWFADGKALTPVPETLPRG